MMQEKFQSKKLAWTQVDNNDDDDNDDNDNYDDNNNNISLLLKSSSSLLTNNMTHRPLVLPSKKINIRRLVTANIAEPSNEPITSVKFHPSNNNLLMVGGMDKHLRFFRIDGDKNEKQISCKFNDYPIMTSMFLGTTGDVILGGRKPFFYTYDIISGSVSKVSGLMGKNMKSHELISVSPEGEKIAFGGGAGYIHICSGKTKTWMMDLKMNTSVRSLCFKDETTLISSGLDADVYIWDLRKTGKCLKRFAHNDGTCTSSLAICNNNITGKGALLAVGAESGVVSLYDDIFNSSSSNNNNNSNKNIIDPLKSIMNLTTKINDMTFHSSGQLLAISSEEKADQLKLVHLPSCSIYTNWPTDKTPFKKVKCMDFSPGGAYFAIGNNKGAVLLYRLNHFINA